MGVSKLTEPGFMDATHLDDYEVLRRLLQYAMDEADRNGEAHCASLISRAVAALPHTSSQSIRNAEFMFARSSNQLS